jgi:hypothetical protein
LPTLLIFIHIEHTFCICPFFVAFFSATIDGRNLILQSPCNVILPRFHYFSTSKSCYKKKKRITIC